MTYRYYYYDVDVPEDCAETQEEREDIAINEAREVTRIYHSPCAWYVVRVTGSIVRVCKKVYVKGQPLTVRKRPGVYSPS